MRIVVAGWVGSANLGDELIFAALVRKLHARGASIVTPSLDAGRTEALHPGVRAIGHLDVTSVLAAVGQADVLVLGGGGLLQNETSWFNLPYHLSRVWMARARSVPFGVLGIGAGRLHGAAAPGLVHASLRSARGVATRDAASARLLERMGIRGVTLAADLAVSLPSPDVEPADRIVACLRPWTGGRGRLPVSIRARRDVTADAMVTRLAQQLDEASRRLGLPVTLVAFQSGWDDVLHRRVAERMTVAADSVTPGLDDVITEVARSRVVIAMRYHAAIAALLGRRPAVLIGYAPKLHGLADAFGAQGRLLDWDAAALEGLGAGAEEVAAADGSLGEALDRLREREAGNDRVLDALLGAR